MEYDGLHVVIYRLPGRPDEMEVVMGVDGATQRGMNSGWTKVGEDYILPGNPLYNLSCITSDDSPVIPLVKRPNHQGDQLFVGTDPKRGIQFTIPASNEEAFARIVKSMFQE